MYAVAARDKDRAEVFAKKHGIEKAYGSYDELIKDPEVDVVYNPVSFFLELYMYIVFSKLNEILVVA